MSDFQIVKLDSVSKIYPLVSGDVVALNNVSLAIEEGAFVAIMGTSGSGKSTLLNQIGILDVPTSGDLYISGRNTKEMCDNERTDMRRDLIGYIFQKFNLIPLLTAYENVEYPLILKYKRRDSTGRAEEMLRKVGINPTMATHTPNELSGGQQQRVAIARALVNDPTIILCDEPTGNLDSRTGTQIMEILSDLNSQGKTIIMVTHDNTVAGYANRIITISDGGLV